MLRTLSRRLFRAGIIVSFTLSGACGSNPPDTSGIVDDASSNAVLAAPAPTPTPVPTPTVAASGYDIAIGAGVDANGFALLPLRAGAHRYFVNSAAGSDGGCTAAENPTTALRTISAAAACIHQGNGDQLLVAEGTSYAEGLPNLDFRSGYSAAYPTVIESYDPADALNESKYGHAGSGRRPVINTGANGQAVTCCTTAPVNYLAIRGFDINPGNRPDIRVSFVGTDNYVLIENNIFRYTTLSFDKWIYAQATNHVIRKNAFYGEWSPTAHAQGIYDAGTDGLTVEDNVFWHVGWKVGASRDDDPVNGGPTMFRHSIYQQIVTNGVIRRNLFIDPSATGCSCRGDTSIQENVFIDNPIAIAAGLGDEYDVQRPNGVTIDIGYNAIFGDANINSNNPRGMAILTGNGKPASIAHDNLIARSRDPNGANVASFLTWANYNRPSYMAFKNNRSYLFSSSTHNESGSFPAQNFPTFDNNVWDALPSGTNVNIASASFPNPYTAAQLYPALGFADKQAFVNYIIERPEQAWAPQVRALLWQGYGMK